CLSLRSHHLHSHSINVNATRVIGDIKQRKETLKHQCLVLSRARLIFLMREADEVTDIRSVYITLESDGDLKLRTARTLAIRASLGHIAGGDLQRVSTVRNRLSLNSIIKINRNESHFYLPQVGGFRPGDPAFLSRGF